MPSVFGIFFSVDLLSQRLLFLNVVQIVDVDLPVSTALLRKDWDIGLRFFHSSINQSSDFSIQKIIAYSFLPMFHCQWEQVFRTPNKGWGVRSWDYIPSGATICEYIGFLMKTDHIDPAAENNYVFDIDCLQTMKGLDGREASVHIFDSSVFLFRFSYSYTFLLGLAEWRFHNYSLILIICSQT